MRLARIRIGLLCAVVMIFGAASAAQGPCEQIRAACQGAGFVQGGARGGAGLQVDCIDPIMQGAAQASKGSRPLPQVDPNIVAACKAGNPSFGQPRALRPDKGGQPSQTSALPPPVAAQSAPAQALAPPAGRPNIVFILTDDLSWDLVQYMPHVRQMQRDGITFTNYFVTDSLCCPSRSSIFTGRYPHDTGIFRNTGADGGYLAFLNRGHERATFATALSTAGYRTAMLGKYLNGYRPPQHPPAPGWAMWAVAGNGYPEFNYALNQDGKIVHYGDTPADYLTDVLSALAVRFVQQITGARFVIEIATFAPHAPYTPAPRDAEALPGLRAPRALAFDAAPGADAPQWLTRLRPLSPADVARIDGDYRKRAQSVLAVDKMLGALQAVLAASGAGKNTYVVFSSDNGYHMGEHRLMPGKMTAYDTDIRVPLIVTGPGVLAGSTNQAIVENVDLCPTFTELGGAVTPATVDGRSLVPLLQGQEVAEWRTAALIEHHGPVKDRADPDMPAMRSGNPPTYEAMRTRTSLYVEYADGTKEYHDLAADPQELHNTFAVLPSADQTALHAALGAMINCHDAKSCRAAGHVSPSMAQK
jgi:N-acetylglucosamine-6-sulfatase